MLYVGIIKHSSMEQRTMSDVGIIKPRKGKHAQTTFGGEKSWTEEDESKVEQSESNVFFETLPMKIAHSRMHWINRTVPALLAAFPLDRKLWHVEFIFPYAKGGPLYIEHAHHPYNIELCRKKAKVMKAAG